MTAWLVMLRAQAAFDRAHNTYSSLQMIGNGNTKLQLFDLLEEIDFAIAEAARKPPASDPTVIATCSIRGSLLATMKGQALAHFAHLLGLPLEQISSPPYSVVLTPPRGACDKPAYSLATLHLEEAP